MAETRVSVLPLEDFTGYPEGKKTAFRKGIESAPMPQDYADLLVQKGHVKRANPVAGKGDAK